MLKYTVYLLTPYAVWEDVEADSEEDAKSKIDIPPEFDFNEFHHILAVEQED